MSTGTSRSDGHHHMRFSLCKWLETFRGRQKMVCPLLLLVLSACDGGMVGTGTGPDEPVAYQTRSLPERIGTDLPAPLIDAEFLAAVFERSSTNRVDDNVTSELWLTLVEQMGEIESLRLKSEESLLLIDAVLPTIHSLCEEGEQSTCRLPAERIEGRYSEALVAGIHALYSRALGTAGDTTIVLDDVRDELQSRLGTTYRLGETELVPSDGQPYDIDLTTSINDVLRNRRLRIRSNASRTRNELTVSSQVGDILDRQYIGFSTGLPGERFTYTRDRAVGDGIEHRFDVSIVADASPERRVLLDARLQHRVGDIHNDIGFSAQVNDEQGFAKSRQYGAVSDAIRNIQLTDESFAADGTLLAGRSCSGRAQPQTCTDILDFTPYSNSGQQVTDNPLFFAEAEFDELTARSDAIQFAVVGLSEDVFDFRVLTDDETLPLIERDVLCTGVQLAPEDVLLYCTAPVDRLSASVVVAVDRDSGVMTHLPLAELMPR